MTNNDKTGQNPPAPTWWPGGESPKKGPRSAECQCTPSFTCGYCLRNAKPWHFTPSR